MTSKVHFLSQHSPHERAEARTAARFICPLPLPLKRRRYASTAADAALPGPAAAVPGENKLNDPQTQFCMKGKTTL